MRSWGSALAGTTFTRYEISSNAPQPAGVATADIDGDTDVIAGSWYDSTFVWYESDGSSPPRFAEHFIAVCGGPEGIAAARIDGDADVDVICAENPASRIQYFDNDANFADADLDGVRDELDCAPADGTAFAAPAEVRGVRFRTRSALEWISSAPSAGLGAAYDVMRGALAQLPPGAGPEELCLSERIESTATVDATDPAAGTGFYYLVRAANACAVGSFGFATSGDERTTAVCPGAEARGVFP